MPFVSEHKGNFGVNVHYWKCINTNLNTFVSGRRSREGGDTRDDLPAYALPNLSALGKDFFKTMEIQGTVLTCRTRIIAILGLFRYRKTSPVREGLFSWIKLSVLAHRTNYHFIY
ncbi:MAG: hypothetical protein A2099_00030 [Planctomycetes bacterium GWF2_39_10]|nr:MAG: hypothetical protein A2099_00030 [Planctomycetes bacterium GWF2_39_10]